MRRRPAAVAVLAFLLVLALGVGLVVQGARRRAVEGRQALAQEAAARAAALGAEIDRLLRHARTLAAAPAGEEAAVAAALQAGDPLLRALVVVPAAGGAEVYAGEGGRAAAAALPPAAAGSGREEASSSPVLVGPLAAAGREVLAAGVPAAGPAPSRGRVWAVAFADELLQAAGISGLPAAGFAYRLTRQREGRPWPVARSEERELAGAVDASLTLPGGPWTFSLALRRADAFGSPVLAGVLLAVALALGAGLAAQDLARRPERLRREVERQSERLVKTGRRLQHEIELRQQAQQQLRHHAFHDALTGLPNRGQLLSALERSLERARRRPGYLIAVLVLDLDRFANVNDTFGHELGDELLLAVARRLGMAIRPQDAAARLGGDEFALLLFDIGSPTVARDVAGRVHGALEEPFRLGGREVFVSASIGIALSSSGYDRPEELVRDADVALFEAKTQGGGRAAVFAPAMREEVAATLELESDLRRAISRGELALDYQPIVSLATGEVTGFEALVRWQHPLEGRLPPGRFLRLAEETGQVVAIDRWVLERACDTARAWRQRLGERAFTVSVNLSGRNLRQADTGDFLTGVVAASGLPAGTVRLELTESEIIDNLPAASELLPRLRREGIPVALDDFGTGYSSLAYLHRFQFDMLKIDRSFILRLLEDERDAGIVRAIVTLARTLGMQTVAEGVEQREQAVALKSLGCEFAQGYLYSRPVAEEAAMALLVAPLVAG